MDDRLAHNINAIIIATLMLLHSQTVSAEINISGYASVVAGKVLTGNQFLADYPKAGVYDTDWSFSPDTSVGIQLSADVNQQISFITQLTSNGATDFEAEADWAYLNYQISAEYSVQFGRKRLPLYYYSDFFDLGYAYYWIRPPSDNYTWQISNYNGVSLLYETQLAEWDSSFNIYVGREDSENNELLSLLFAAPTDETWKNMLGFVGEFSKHQYELRMTYLVAQLDRNINDIQVANETRQQFAGLSLNFYGEQLVILSEFNRYKRSADEISVRTSMLSAGYHINDFTPHITRSTFKQSVNAAGGDENHTTNSIGLRWDIEKNTALKIQYDKVEDKGINIPILGDSSAISIGMDIVF